MTPTVESCPCTCRVGKDIKELCQTLTMVARREEKGHREKRLWGATGGRKVDWPNPCDIGEVRREIMATEVARLLKTQERMPRTDQTFATLAK